jgi:O-antigen/teichoic acid export membrane protein
LKKADATKQESTLRRNALLVMASSVLIGLGNYGFSLTLIWILPARSFSEVASANSLLLVAGSAGSAIVPWVVAREVTRTRPGSEARAQAVTFALVVAVVLGVLSAAITVALAAPYAQSATLLPLAIASVGVFVAGVGVGHLQGAARFVLLAGGAAMEVAAKVGFGIAFSAFGFGAPGAVWGAATGAVLWATMGLWIVRHDLRLPRQRVHAALWRQLVGNGGIQIFLSVLASLDVVIGSLLEHRSTAFAGYQAMLVFARVPQFTSTAVGTVAYQRLSADNEEHDDVVAGMTRLFLLVSVATVPAVATIPGGLLSVVVPGIYGSSDHLLLPLGIAGFAFGMTNLATTYLQARSRFSAALCLLAVATVLAAATYAPLGSNVDTLAWSTTVVEALLAVGAVGLLAREFASVSPWRQVVGWCLVMAAATAVLHALAGILWAWIIVVAAVAALAGALLHSGLSGSREVQRVLVLSSSNRHRSDGVARTRLSGGAEVSIVVAGVCKGGLRRRWFTFREIRRSRPDVIVVDAGAPVIPEVRPWMFRGLVAAVCPPDRAPAARGRTIGLWLHPAPPCGPPAGAISQVVPHLDIGYLLALLPGLGVMADHRQWEDHHAEAWQRAVEIINAQLSRASLAALSQPVVPPSQSMAV